jgi:hypothetical protein
LGKKKRAAMRCHWCTPGGEHSAPPCAAQAQKPDDPQDPSSPAACPLRPLVKPLFLWRDGEVQEMQSTVPNFSIPKVRHVSGPCWQAELGDIKDHITALQENSAPWGWALCTRPWTRRCASVAKRQCVCRISQFPHLIKRLARISSAPGFFSSTAACGSIFAALPAAMTRASAWTQ